MGWSKIFVPQVNGENWTKQLYKKYLLRLNIFGFPKIFVPKVKEDHQTK